MPNDNESLYAENRLKTQGLRNDYTPYQEPDIEAPEEHSFARVVKAEFFTENLIGTAIHNSRFREDTQGRFDREFSVADRLRDSEYTDPDDIEFLGRANNEEDFQNLERQLEDYKRERQVIGEAGTLKQLGAGFTSALVDPTSYLGLPGITGAGSIALKGARVAGATAAYASAREAFLHANQPHRTGEESLNNIALESVFTGAVGSAAGFVLTKYRGKLGAEIENQARGQQGAPTQADISGDTGYLLGDGIDPTDINGRIAKLRKEGHSITDNSGRELPDLNLATGDLTARGRVALSDDFLLLSRANGNTHLDDLIADSGVAKEHPKWSYAQRAKYAIDKYVNDGNPTDDIKATRLAKVREWQNNYMFGEYAKKADSAEQRELSEYFAENYTARTDISFNEIKNDIEVQKTLDPITREPLQTPIKRQSAIQRFETDEELTSDFASRHAVEAPEIKHDKEAGVITAKWNC